MLNFQENADLIRYTTFGVQAKAKLFVEINSESDFLDLLETGEWKNNQHLFLGTGANVLFTRDFDGLVVKINIFGKNIVEKNDNNVVVEVGAGEDRNNFVERTIDQGWAGIENMISIPSSVGAAAFGNIGAYGMEAKDRIVSVTGINTATKETTTISNSECGFGYRESIFKQQFKDNFLITRVRFNLDVYTPDYILNTNYKDVQQYIADSGKEINIKTLSQAISEIRASKLPDWKTLGTAGSFFKNPIVSKERVALLRTNFVHLVSFDIPNDPAYVKLSAGQLIELARFKGYRKGKVGVYDKHALILVNYGGATGREIANLAGEIQDKVQEMFSVSLSPEVIYV
ncbi:MAG: UDP-N-acetylmuramate dehydrogenase [Candidatus Absconditabacteria bacterium]|nr:UDP-N-acetylmuramate dehydrogenase [Candidatus Absconditabacteria bacterium]